MTERIRNLITILSFCIVSYSSTVPATAENLTLAGDARWLVLAARPELPKAVEEAKLYAQEYPGVRVAVSKLNGWFVIISGPEPSSDRASVRARHLDKRRRPSDAYLATGANYAATMWSAEASRLTSPTQAQSLTPPSSMDVVPRRVATATITPDTPVETSPPVAPAASYAAPASVAAAYTGNWHVEDKRDKFDDSPYTAAIVFGTSEDQSTFRSLGVICQKGSIGLTFMSEWPVISIGGIAVRYRLDGGEAVSETWRRSMDGTQAGPTDTIGFLNNLRGRRQLLIRATDFTGSSKDSVFNLADVEGVIARMSAGCPNHIAAR